jgi:hypothetical protein
MCWVLCGILVVVVVCLAIFGGWVLFQHLLWESGFRNKRVDNA